MNTQHTAEKDARTGSGLVCTYCGARGHLNAPCPDLQASDNAENDAPVVMTLYRTKVHPRNLNSDYGIPVDVFANNRSEAVNRAVDVGWSGERRDARVTLLSVEQVCVSPAGKSERGLS